MPHRKTRFVTNSIVLSAALSGCVAPTDPQAPHATSSAVTMSNSLKRRDGKVWIEGIDTYRVMDPLFDGVRIILAARGDVYPPAYIQGITGSAFRIGGICPCAPTCANAMSTEDLIKLLGYEYEKVPLDDQPGKLEASMAAAVARVRKEIDAGRAALVWHAFTYAEFDVVFGYDAAGGKFLGRGSYAGNDIPFASADEKRMSTCGSICPVVGAILIGRKTGTFDARAAELAALREAVKHARWQPAPAAPTGDKWVMYYGIACYDRWVADFRKNPKKAPNGSQYCYNVVRSTHRAAAGFLRREIAPKHPKMAEPLRQAAERFEKEADILDSGEALLCWNAPKELTEEHCRKAAEVLQRAREQYVAGMDLIASALAAMEKP